MVLLSVEAFGKTIAILHFESSATQTACLPPWLGERAMHSGTGGCAGLPGDETNTI